MLAFLKTYSIEIFNVFALLSAISLIVSLIVVVIGNRKKIYDIAWKIIYIILKRLRKTYIYNRIYQPIFTLFYIYISFIKYIIALNIEKRGGLFNIKWKRGFMSINEYDMYNTLDIVSTKWYYKLFYMIFYSSKFEKTEDMFVDWARWTNSRIIGNFIYIVYYLSLCGYIYKYIYVGYIFIYLIVKSKCISLLHYILNTEVIKAIYIYIYLIKNSYIYILIEKCAKWLWDITVNVRLQFYYLTVNFVFYHTWVWFTRGKYWAEWHFIDNIDEYGSPRWIFLPKIKDNLIRTFLDKFGWSKPLYIDANNSKTNIFWNLFLMIKVALGFVTTALTNIVIFTKNSFTKSILLFQYNYLYGLNILERPYKISKQIFNKLTNINIYLSIIPYGLYLLILSIYKYIIIYTPLILIKLLNLAKIMFCSLRLIIPIVIIICTFNLDLFEFFSIFTLEWILRHFADIFASAYSIKDYDAIIIHNPYWGIEWYSHRWWGRAGIKVMQRSGFITTLYPLDTKIYNFVKGLKAQEIYYKNIIEEDAMRVADLQWLKANHLFYYIADEFRTKRTAIFTIYITNLINSKIATFLRTSHFFWINYARYNVNYANCLLISSFKTVFIIIPLRLSVWMLKKQDIWLIWIIYKILVCINIVYNTFAKINYIEIVKNTLLYLITITYSLLVNIVYYFYKISWYKIIIAWSDYKISAHKWIMNVILGDIIKAWKCYYNYDHDYNLLIKVANWYIYQLAEITKQQFFIYPIKINWGMEILVALISLSFKIQMWIDDIYIYLQLPSVMRKHGIDYIHREEGYFMLPEYISMPRRTAIYTHSNWLIWPKHYWYCLNKANVFDINLDMLKDYKIYTRTRRFSNWNIWKKGIRMVLRENRINKSEISLYYQPFLGNNIGKDFTKNLPSVFQGTAIIDSMFIYYFTLLFLMILSNGFYNAIIGKNNSLDYHMNQQYAWEEFRSEPIKNKKWFFYNREEVNKYSKYFKFVNNWKTKNSYYPIYLSKVSDIGLYNESLWKKLKQSSLLKKANKIDAGVWISPLFLNYYSLEENNNLHKNLVEDNKNFQLLIAFGYNKDVFIELSWNDETTESYEDILKEVIIDQETFIYNIKEEEKHRLLQNKAEKFLIKNIGWECKFSMARDYDNIFQVRGNNIVNNETKAILDDGQYGYTPWAIIFWFVVCPLILFNKAFQFMSGYNIHHQVNTNVLAVQEHMYIDAMWVSHSILLRTMRDFAPDIYAIDKNRGNIDVIMDGILRSNYLNYLNDDYSYMQYFWSEGYDGYYGPWVMNYWTPQTDYGISDISLYLQIIKYTLLLMLLFYSRIRAKKFINFCANLNYKKYINYKKLKIVIKKLKAWYWQ